MNVDVSSVQKDSPGEPWVSANDRDPVSSITKIFLAGYICEGISKLLAAHPAFQLDVENVGQSISFSSRE